MVKKPITKGRLRGLLFEILIDKLLKRAGFIELKNRAQLTKQLFRFHGRGTTHQIDAFGEFCFSVPFVFPIRILAEAKSKKNGVSVGEVRNFFGAVADISEWYNLDTASMSRREIFMQRFQERYMDCGAFFSTSGFRNQAEEFAFAHGIFLVSYKNTVHVPSVYSSMLELIEHINLENLSYDDAKKISKYIFDFMPNQIPSRIKLEGFDPALTALRESFDQIHSYLGMLNGRTAINIISKGSSTLPENDANSSKIQFLDGRFILKNGNFEGEFSLPQRYLEYLSGRKKKKYSRVKNRPNTIFSFIDVALSANNYVKITRISNLQIEPNIAHNVLKYLEKQDEEYAARRAEAERTA